MIMKKILILPGLLLLTALLTLKAEVLSENDFATLRRQLTAFHAGREGNVDEAEKYLREIRPDGSWSDLDYQNTQLGRWPTQRHLTRARLLALAYADPAGRLAGKIEVAAAARSALEFWIKNDFKNPNWWPMQIGVPQTIAAALIMLGDQAPPELIARARPLLERSKPGMTGQNRVWLSAVHALKGMVYRDAGMVKSGRDVIFEELAIAPRDREGLQPDWSFHQHGPQHQFGNYGLGFVDSMVQWGTIFAGTSFAMTPEQTALLRNYLLDGTAWTIYRGNMDISACGRHLFRNSSVEKANSAFKSATLAAKFDIEGAAGLEAFAKGVEPVGNRYFWCSDYLIQRRPDYYFSFKMGSKRIIGTESYNNENLQGRYLGDGVALLYRDGREYRDIYPFWNWRQLPGSTELQDNDRLRPWGKKFENESEFVGGLSDGKIGAAVMDFKRKEFAVRQTWFCFDRYLVHFTSGLNAPGKAPAVTGITQEFVAGPVEIKTSGADARKLEGGKTKAARVESLRHRGVGWFFPDRPELELSLGKVAGNWQSINQADPADPVEAEIFAAAINHGADVKGGSALWIVSPDGSDPAANGIEILVRTPDLVAAADRKNQVVMAVFFAPGAELKLPGGDKLKAISPCIAMLSRSPAGTVLTAADPTQRLASLQFEQTFNGKTETVDLALQSGSEAGKCQSVSLTK